ncbi:MAG: hypothetical protein WDN72_00085 [Alphaproteobacteria bacterium]
MVSIWGEPVVTAGGVGGRGMGEPVTISGPAEDFALLTEPSSCTRSVSSSTSEPPGRFSLLGDDALDGLENFLHRLVLLFGHSPK